MWTNIYAALGAGLLGLALASPAAAQAGRAAPGQPEARTALALMPAKAKLTVTSPAFRNGGDIPFENTQYRGNTFPGLAWTEGPAGTTSYVVIMQDSTFVVRGAPILHWVMFNIPARVTSLPAGMAPDAKPAGSAYGPNYKGAATPYTGPRTPPGVNGQYHFAVFALDVTVPEAAAASYQVLTDAMQGHVLAGGEVLGVGHADPDAPPPAPRPPAS